MKLSRLQVAGWRCFPGGIELSGLGDGLNVVYGPNGVGKTSLFKALVRVFCDRHSVKAEAIRNLQPWGTDLSPQAAIEFEHEGSRWQIEKRFLQGASSKLQRFDGGRWIPVANDAKADERLHDMLQVECPKSGATKREQWGLAQMLWAEQGELQVSALSAPSKQTLQAALGAQVASAETTAVEALAAEAYAASFTGQGKLKSGQSAPPVVRLREDLQQAVARAADLRRKLQAYDVAVHKIEGLRLVADQAEREEQEVIAQEDKIRAAAQAYEQAAARRDLAAKEADAAKAKAEQIRSRLEAVTAARQELDQLKATIAQQDRDAEGVHADLETRRRLDEDMRRKLETVRAGRNAYETADRRARRAEMLTRAGRDAAAAKDVLDRVAALIAERATVQTERAAVIAPDAKQLPALRKAWRDRDDARLRLDASLITIEFTAEIAAAADVITGEPAGSQSVAAGETVVAKGAPEVVLQLAGIGRIRARGPAGSVEQLRRDAQTTETALEQLLVGFADKDLSLLEAGHLRAVELDQRVKQLTIQIDALLNRRSREEWEQDLRMTEHKVEEILVEEPTWRTTAPDAAALASARDKIHQDFKTAIDFAEGQKDLAAKSLQDATLRKATLEEARRGAQSQCSSTESRLLQLTADGRSDAERSAAYEHAALAWAAAQGQLKAAEAQLAAFTGDPRGELKLLQKHVESLRQQANESKQQLKFAEGELQKIIQESPYSALATEEENVARLQEEIARHELQLAAAKLLHETLTAKRRGVVESLVGPIRQRAGRTLQRIIGPRFAELDISEEFSAAGVVPRDQTASVDLKELSGGEQEQVHFAVRLALADIAFPDGRHLVVLDDVFTFTDRERLARIVQVLGEAAERFQIVMLTCHPERYRGLENAKFFDLEAIARGAA